MARQQKAPRQQRDQQRTRAQSPVPQAGTRSRGLLVSGAVGLAVVVLLGATLLATRSVAPTAQASCAARGARTGVSAGQCAPNFTLADAQGRPVSLAQFRGHPILLHFWAVACPTCAAEYPDFSRAVRADVPKGLTVLAVDAWGEPPSMVRQWQARHHLPATLLIDQPQAIVREYRVQGTPTTFFIDRTGHIVSSDPSPLTYAAFQRTISRIL
ncbi:MAG TPA: TlpA disulfide reductase family protein [Chloroflexota bacterium]|nr:TlpA disulfide reductase family protein [Chloroflexota bacterium]